jgi:hypothetical protein
MYYNINKNKKSIKSYQNFFINTSIEKEKQQKKYVENIDVIDKNGVVKPLTYDFLKISFDNYLNIVQRTTYLQNLQQQKDEKHIGFFITLTLPTQYHPYKNNNQNYNENYDDSLTINDGYKVLIDIFKKVQKDLYDVENNKKVNLDFIKVVEYHKSMVPHLHGVVFVPERLVKRFKQHIINVFGNVKLQTIKDEKTNKIKYVENKNIGRSEVEQLNDIERVVPYLLKYIKKSLNPLNERDYHLLNGWKKVNKIRVFTMSNVSIPRFISKKLYNHLGKYISKTDNYNILEELENMCNIEVNIFKHNEYQKTKQYGVNNGRFRVIVDLEKTDYIQYKNNYNNSKKSYKLKGFNVWMVLQDPDLMCNKYDVEEEYEEIEDEYEDEQELFEIGETYDINEEYNEYQMLKYERILESNSNGKTKSERFTKTKYTVYTVTNFVILDTQNNKVVYNKKDFTYINNN